MVLNRSNISWLSIFKADPPNIDSFFMHLKVVQSDQAHTPQLSPLPVKHPNTLDITMHKHTSTGLPSVGEVFSRLHSPSTPP